MSDHPALTPALRQLAERRWQRICHALAQYNKPLRAAAPQSDPGCCAPPLVGRELSDADREGALPVLMASEFIARTLVRQPDHIAACLDAQPLDPQGYPALIAAAMEGCTSENAFGVALRQLRNRELTRIAWADLSGRAPVSVVLSALSALADAIIDASARFLYEQFCQQWGTPRSAQGEPQVLLVLGMGKLGGAELNFSSDVDLIFAFAEPGQCDGRRQIDNGEFFARLGRRLIQLLGDNTADGFVYRVDMRLRPFGEVGPFATSFDALENYYLVHGREWERYALIKARAVSDPATQGPQLLAALRSFIYRSNPDYGAIAELRELKAKIVAKVNRAGLRDDIKLGAGGIREIEFIGQIFQLLYGGRVDALRSNSIEQTLRALPQHGHLSYSDSEMLLTAYRFLRKLENRLQIYDDQQTHALPKDLERLTALAVSMGFSNCARFEFVLSRQRNAVEQLFRAIFKLETNPGRDNTMKLIWNALDEEDGDVSIFLQAIADAGFSDPEQALNRLQMLKRSRYYQRLEANARTRLDQLMPRTLLLLKGRERKDEILKRLLLLLRSPIARSGYLSPMDEAPAALERLLDLLDASEKAAEYLAHQPQQLGVILYTGKKSMASDYADVLRDARIAVRRAALMANAKKLADNAFIDHQLHALCRYQKAQLLQVTGADVAGALDIDGVSRQLNWIAQSILQILYELHWTQLVHAHGVPRYRLNGEWHLANFGIIAYGKLGSEELAYNSDLDLVFIYDSAGEQQSSDGCQALDNVVWFSRLAQRIISSLGQFTQAGALYEADVRLRPNGKANALAGSLQAFAEYQCHEAWIWEHQALVRSRMVVGGAELRKRFTALRQHALCQPRVQSELPVQIVTMREKMLNYHGRSGETKFDLKWSRGGCVDIEFIVQYLVLIWAKHYPQLINFSDSARLLLQLEELELLDAGSARHLAAHHRKLRQQMHALMLQGKACRVDPSAANSLYAARTNDIWHSLFGHVVAAQQLRKPTPAPQLDSTG